MMGGQSDYSNHLKHSIAKSLYVRISCRDAALYVGHSSLCSQISIAKSKSSIALSYWPVFRYSDPLNHSMGHI